ncbi:hypothetical protein LSH36_589g03027 [Paralvinella palmiformis]|uniref:Uncharacterized protein n=1 Tax=Paralvinella palmiformis TaxID=53620 RepID=A0AAD9J4W9_9ANNE|nr:hypothetical protein LSH36_589g03027 [Paralvinella palmiformis]
MCADLATFYLRYFVILSLSAAINPLTLPEIEAINMTARLEQARFRHERILQIQKAILDGLGLDTTPTINVTNIQNADAKRMLERFYRISGSDGVPEVVVEGEGMDEYIFETILLLAERGSVYVYVSACLRVIARGHKLHVSLSYHISMINAVTRPREGYKTPTHDPGRRTSSLYTSMCTLLWIQLPFGLPVSRTLRVPASDLVLSAF